MSACSTAPWRGRYNVDAQALISALLILKVGCWTQNFAFPTSSKMILKQVVLSEQWSSRSSVAFRSPWLRSFELCPYIFFICSYFDGANFRFIIYFQNALTVIQKCINWQSGNDFEKREHKKLLKRKPDPKTVYEAARIDRTLKLWSISAKGPNEEMTHGDLGANGKHRTPVSSQTKNVGSAKRPCDTGRAR